MSSRYKLHPHWTAKRHEWLERLEKTPGITRAGGGIVGFHCMRLGWTKWTENCDGEVLTDEGRDKLNEWRAAQATRQRRENREH